MASTARKKAWRPKSKTGCLTCRTRRVKCGEEKPECLRCTKSGRKCDGYGPDGPEMSSTGLARRVSTESSPIASSIASPIASIIATSSPIIEKDEKETGSLNFFINNTAPELAGNFESRFWNSLVLQRCRSDPPVRHAVIALGAFHEFFKFGDKKLLEAGAIDDPKQRFALQQNNEAIRHLTGHLSQGGNPQSPEVILISCLLFICFEAMQGNHQAAFAHLHSGLKILGDCAQMNKNYQNGDSESNLTLEFIRSELVPLFGALDIQTTKILPTSWEMTKGSSKFDFRTQTSIPDSISSLNEAKYHLQNQTHAILEYHRSVAQNCSLDTIEKADALRPNSTNAIMEGKRKHASKLEQWSTAFHNFAQTAGQTMDTKDLRASISLELDYETNKLILETALFETEMDYDRCVHQFELMTSLAESLLKSYSNSRTEHGPVFSFDTVIILPLVFVVCKCRDPSIRRKAHTLLSTSFRREGLWDSDYASSIGKWSIDKEEKGLENISKVEEVLQSTRIVVSEITSLGRRRALIKFRQGPRREAGDLDLQEELIVW